MGSATTTRSSYLESRRPLEFQNLLAVFGRNPKISRRDFRSRRFPEFAVCAIEAGSAVRYNRAHAAIVRRSVAHLGAASKREQNLLADALLGH